MLFRSSGSLGRAPCRHRQWHADFQQPSRRYLVRGRQERQELVAGKWGRFDGQLGMALKEAHVVWSSLLALLLASDGVVDEKGNARPYWTLPRVSRLQIVESWRTWLQNKEEIRTCVAHFIRPEAVAWLSWAATMLSSSIALSRPLLFRTALYLADVRAFVAGIAAT